MMVLDKRRTRRGTRPMAARPPVTGVAVDEEQCRRLAECCAFFLASRFRPAQPGGYRGRDLSEATARIAAIIKRHAPK